MQSEYDVKNKILTKWKLAHNFHFPLEGICTYIFEPEDKSSLFKDIRLSIKNKESISLIIALIRHDDVIILEKKLSKVEWNSGYNAILTKEFNKELIYYVVDAMETVEKLDLKFKQQIYDLVIVKTELHYQKDMMTALEKGLFKEAFEIAKNAESHKFYNIIWDLAETIHPNPNKNSTIISTPTVSNENDNAVTPPLVEYSIDELIDLYKEIIKNPDNPHQKEAKIRLFDLLESTLNSEQYSPIEKQNYGEIFVGIGLELCLEGSKNQNYFNRIAHAYSGFEVGKEAFLLTGKYGKDILQLFNALKLVNSEKKLLQEELKKKQLEEHKNLTSKALNSNTNVSKHHFIANTNRNENKNNNNEYVANNKTLTRSSSF